MRSRIHRLSLCAAISSTVLLAFVPSAVALPKESQHSIGLSASHPLSATSLHNNHSTDAPSRNVPMMDESTGDEGFFSLSGISITGGLNGLFGWLNPFGEGVMIVQIPHHTNLSLPHRQSAFPSRLPIENALPLLSAILRPITSFPIIGGMNASDRADVYGCWLPPALLLSSGLAGPTDSVVGLDTIRSARYATSETPQVALVLRGRCSFSRKVASAQARGASGVLIGDEALVYSSGGAAGRRVDHDYPEEGEGGDGGSQDEAGRESDEDGRKRKGLLTMYSPEDTSKIVIPSSFVSRSTYLRLRDIFSSQSMAGEKVGLVIDLIPDEGFSWPVTDLFFLVLLLPSIMTIGTILMNRYRMERQRRAERAERAPPVAVLNLPERIWEPEEWTEQEEDALLSGSGGVQAVSRPESPTATIVGASARKDVSESASAPHPASGPGVAQEASNSPSQVAHLLPLAEFRTNHLATGTLAPRPTAPRFKQTECAICLAPFERGDPIRILPCGHVFHKDEVDAWLLGWKKVCPVCRSDIMTGTAPSSPGTEDAAQNADGPGNRGLLGTVGHWLASFGITRSHWLAQGHRRGGVPDAEEGGVVAASASDDENAPLLAGSNTLMAVEASTMTDGDRLDAEDPIAWTRNEFELPQRADSGGEGPGPLVYLCGNSLGLLAKTARKHMEEELNVWSRRAVSGHFNHPHDRPWKAIDEKVVPGLAQVVGAKESEIAHSSTLTSNIHSLFVSFYRPTKTRWRIIIEKGAFPSDMYAVHSHPPLHSATLSQEQIDNAIIAIEPRPQEECLRTSDIVSIVQQYGDEIAVVWLSGVQYYTGQYFQVPPISEAAHQAGALLGLDLAHAVGNVPVKLDEWNVDFAAWCTYKYLNSGPGAVAGYFIKDGLDDGGRRLAGWWGQNRSTRFQMGPIFDPIPGAAGYQHSNPPLFSTIPLIAHLDILSRCGGMPALRAKSIKLTGYLHKLLTESPFYNAAADETGFRIITPSDPDQRGCQLSLMLGPVGSGCMGRVFERMVKAGIVGDERQPDVIRLSPAPLYNGFRDVELAVAALNAALAEEA